MNDNTELQRQLHATRGRIVNEQLKLIDEMKAVEKMKQEQAEREERMRELERQAQKK